MAPPRGKFIVVEGIDKSGKTTACTAVARILRAEGVKLIERRFPSRSTSIGHVISQFLQGDIELTDDAILLLMAADRRQEEPVIERLLAAGNTILCDRYTWSGAAYGIASQGRGMTPERCMAPDVGLLVPDMVIYFDVQPEVAAERGCYGEERLERLDYQKRVYEAYKHVRSGTWKAVDASLSPHELAKAVAAICRDVVTGGAPK